MKEHGQSEILLVLYLDLFDKELNSVVNLWRNFNKTEHLLIDTRGNKMTTNGLTKFLYQTFEPTGKRISSSMIRHIYLTEKYGDET